MSKAKTVLKGFGILLLILAGILLLLLVYLTVREYRPKAEESLEGNYKDGAFISLRSPFSVMTTIRDMPASAKTRTSSWTAVRK